MSDEVIEVDENGNVHAGGNFGRDLEALINRYSQENPSNTPGRTGSEQDHSPVRTGESTGKRSKSQKMSGVSQPSHQVNR